MAKRTRLNMKPQQAGFTLVELLLVTFIFVIVGAGILGSYLSSHFLSSHSRDAMVATEDLKDMMERISATPFTALLATFPAGTANANGYQAIVSGQTGGVPNAFSLQNESIAVTYPSQATDRLEVLVTVTWRTLGRDRVASAATVKTSS